jgi:hypothetical protein
MIGFYKLYLKNLRYWPLVKQQPEKVEQKNIKAQINFAVG